MRPRRMGFPLATNRERVHVLKTLLDRGYVRQILLALDICNAHLLKKCGGKGYARAAAVAVNKQSLAVR